MVRAEKELRMHLKSVSEKAFDIYCSETTSEIRNRLLREQPELRSNLTEFRKVLLSEIFFRAGNSIQDSKILASSAFNTFFEFRNKVVFFEGAINVLIALSEKYKVYALTNGNADVKMIGIDKYLSGAVSSAEVGVSKPSPEIFEVVLNKAGEEAKSCIHVGDDYEDDIVGANNAGIASRGRSVVDTDPEEMRRVVATHAFGPHYLAALTLPKMRTLGRGDIVMISSVATRSLGPNGAPYNMGKTAMEALAYTLAKEEREHGIRVNIVAPGLVDTDMGQRLIKAVQGVEDIRSLDQSMPFGRVCQPEDVANVVRFLVSDENSYLTGERLYCDGGGQLLR